MELIESRILLNPDLKELIPGFLEFIEREVKMAYFAIKKSDYETVFKLGGRMKSFGGSYGFEVITDAGLTIEAAAEEQNARKAEKSLETLASYLASIEIVYDDENY